MKNMQGMMKQMQKMQQQMESEQKALEATEFMVEDSQGLVQVRLNGRKELVDLVIAKDLVDPEDIDMLQDLVLATINQGLQEVDQATQDRMGRFTQGLKLPF